MKYKIFTILILLSSTLINAQSLSGAVVDSLKSPVPYIPLALLNAKDSSIVKGTNTDDKGAFLFEKIQPGKYLVKIVAVGYKEKFSPVYIIDTLIQINTGNLTISSSAVNLNEVSVSAIKNTIEFKGGNIIVNVEDSPLAIGNNAYDLIARLPGVMVDNENISILGKSGAKVFVNDRQLQMSGAQLISFLRSLNASSIEKIDILNNPPARYDAAGNAGIINIKTKKIKITGFSGGVNFRFSKGIYHTNTGGFALNYKGNKVTFFSNLGFDDWKVRHESNFTKTVNYNSLTTTLDQTSYQLDMGAAFNFNVGADWYINKNNTIGIKAQGLSGRALRTYSGNTNMSDNSLGYDQLLFNRPIDNPYYWGNYNINAEHLFDTNGTRLRFSADYYSPYDDVYQGVSESRFLGKNGLDTLAPQTFKTSNNIGISIIATRLDFEKKFKKDLSLEAGIKQNYQDIYSNYTFENKNNVSGDYVLDSIFTNKFSYKEMISAAYITVAKQYKKTNIQLGLRGENTNIHTSSLTNSIKYTRQYLNLFPVLSCDYNPNKDHSMSFAYNRRINRPDYNSFNPYREFLNVLNSSEGNPYLLPIFDNNFNLNYIYKGKISNFLSYSQSENPIIGYSSQNDSTKETIFRVTNLKKLNIARYNLFIRQDIKKWWTVSFLAGAYYIDYTGTFNGSNFSTRAIPWYTRLTWIFILKKDLKVEMSGFYWSPWLGGAGVFLERGGVNWAIRKSFLDKALTVSISMNDVFFTETFRSKTNFENQNWQRFEAHDSRRFNVSLNYNFGKIKAQQRQTKGNDEEKNRLGH